ncbi:Uncharacterised protein [Mycobacteroides abscessus subsp. abscessus]|nr:Uncharacterised protein [Mycobacteroides abscessus subsp. abscessus]
MQSRAPNVQSRTPSVKPRGPEPGAGSDPQDAADRDPGRE